MTLAFYFNNSFVRGIGFLFIYLLLTTRFQYYDLGCSWLMCCSSSTEATSMIISGGGTREYRVPLRKSTSWGREERHWWLGWEQSSRTCVEVASATTLLSPGARETGNESTVEVDVTNGAGEAGCRTTKAALLGPGRMAKE